MQGGPGGLGLAVGDGLVRLAAALEAGASGPLAVQPAIAPVMASADRRRTTPFLTAG